MLKRFVQKFYDLMTKVASTSGAAVAADQSALHKVRDGRVEKSKLSEAAGAEGASKPRRQKIVKYAMLLCYQGKNYFGMQVQRDGRQTIEGHLLDAMLKLNWITEALHAKPFDFHFQRAARTDRAVSAVRQLVSMQLPFDEERPITGMTKMNELLPEDIRVFGIRRVTKLFHAQKDCSARTYTYTLPTFAFAKSDQLTNWQFRLSPEARAEINDILSVYVGTHNFFNYTSKLQAQCKRYIISFECGEPFLVRDEFRNQDVEFVTLKVKGQSFIMHHIRKMIGMTVSVVRELQLRSAIQRSFEDERMDVPRAPGLGLILDRLHYDWYDKRFAATHGALTTWSDETEEAMEKFKREIVLKEVFDTELTTQSMMQWLTTLPQHMFYTDPEVENLDNVGPMFVHLTYKKLKEDREEFGTQKTEEEGEEDEMREEGGSDVSEPEKQKAQTTG